MSSMVARRDGPADSDQPPLWVGFVVAALAVALTTLLLYPLRNVAPAVSLGVVYLVAVLLVASVWPLWLGVLTALASAAAFNWFHIPPTGRFSIAEGENWVALVIYFVAAVVASTLAERARGQRREVDQRRREADLSAEMARLLLRDDLDNALPAAAQRLATTLNIPSAAIELQVADADERRVAFPLRDGSRQIGTLLVSADVPEQTLRRLQERIVPSLEALLAAALERDELLADSVETRALRRSDVVKTALLRAVSHDLRSPLTAILNSAGPLEGETIDDGERRELAHAITEEAERLARLIDNLLDLSRLEAGAAEAHPVRCSVAEVVEAAIDELRLDPELVRVSIDPETPELNVDPAQLQRALANLIANAVRYSDGEPVLVRAAPRPRRVLMRIVDRGPGIPEAQRERIFEPFYRAGTRQTGYRGSGLGLAIARGFIESNGGHVWVESLPGQGTSFVVELPLPTADEAAPAPADPAPAEAP